MKKPLALLMVILMLFVSTAGCIDIHLLKDLLVPRQDEEQKFEEVEYTVLRYNFTSNILGLDPAAFIEHYEGNETVPIIEGTERMRFDITVNMRSAKDIWDQINDTINDTFPGVGENLAPYVEAILLLLGQRYVEITILKPDGTEWYHNTTRVSMDAEVFIQGPEEGDWMVEVEGDGIGIRSSSIDESYIDSFLIDVLIRQPEI
jgi:hypothetical protein